MPRFIKAKAFPKALKGTAPQREVAETLVALLPTLVGENKMQVERALQQEVQLNPKIVEGLVQLLIQLSQFSEGDSKGAALRRAEVFDVSADYWKHPKPLEKAEAHREVMASRLPQLPEFWTEQPISFLFNDLQSQQKLVVAAPINAEELIDRYNLAQAQGLLIRASSIELEIRGTNQIQRLLQMLKFFGLLFVVKSQTEKRLVITIDGPTSLLEGSRSYGVELANFFPAVVSLKGAWSLKAPIKVPGKPGFFLFECSEQLGYRSHYKQESGQLGARLLEVSERFTHKYGPQSQAQLTHQLFSVANNQVLLPDLKITEGEKQGWVQWLGYLSPAKQAWLVELKKHLPQNYRFVFKGKPVKYQGLVDQMAPHLVLFSSQLTAPGLKRILEAL